MVINVILSPPVPASNLQAAPPSENPKSAVDHPLDKQIVRWVHNGTPIRLWTIVEEVVHAHQPRSRQERRRLRGEILDRVGSLIRRRVIERVGPRRELVRLRQRELPVPQSVPVAPAQENSRFWFFR